MREASRSDLPPYCWPDPPAHTGLSCGDVHVWCASLDRLLPGLPALVRTLSEDERKRSERFRFKQDRMRFTLCRGTLRGILSRYLAVSPAQVRFCATARGKPALADANGGDRLRFNLSHSHGYVLYAITGGVEIGVDLERVRPVPEADQIVRRFFSSTENDAYFALPPARRPEAFFNCWTRKEAYLKATGEGFFRPLDRFDVSFVPDAPARLLRVDGDPDEALRWSLQALTPVAGYAAALVTEGPRGRLSCWRWSAPWEDHR